MENMAIMNVLFSLFAGAVIGLLSANALFVVLRIAHKKDLAASLSKKMEPLTSYLMLGGKSDAERHSGHA